VQACRSVRSINLVPSRIISSGVALLVFPASLDGLAEGTGSSFSADAECLACPCRRCQHKTLTRLRSRKEIRGFDRIFDALLKTLVDQAALG
jgi:hypothetical protein